MSDAPRRAVRWRLRGRVQGVGFRYFTVRAARRLGIVGRVRNLPDGSVEVEAAGAPEDLQRLEAEVSRGPAGARVLGVEEQELPGPPDWDGFEVDYY